MKKNVSGQKVGAEMVSATDGSAFTSAVTAYITLDAGTQAVGTVGSGACTHEGNGYHTYAPSQAETNGDLVAVTFIGTGAVPATVQIYTTFPQTGDSYAEVTSGTYGLSVIESLVDDIGAAGAGLTAIPWNAAWDAEVQSEVQDAIEANNLDHLVKIAVDTNFATTVHADSVIGQIADNGAGFDRTTDSLEAIRDRGDAAWTTATGFSTHSAADVWAVATRALTVIDEDSTTLDLDATIRAAVGLAAADLDTQLATIDNFLDTEIAAIKAKTDQLTFTTANQVDATTMTVATGAIGTGDIAAAALNEIADAILDRNMATGTDSGSTTVRTLRQAARALRNKVSISGGTATITKEDDSTASWTAAVTTTPGDPISAVDPAGP